MRSDLAERAERACVALDGDHLPGPFRQKRARQAARTGSDLHHRDARKRPGGASDLSGEGEVEAEILSKGLAGVQPMRRDHVTERRQAVRSEAHRVNRSASLSAAMRLA